MSGAPLSGAGTGGGIDPALLHAGRYALYVWPAYGISLAVLALLTLLVVSRARRWRRRAQGAEGARARSRAAGALGPADRSA